MTCMITGRGIPLNLEEAFGALMGYRIIFFGEEHGSRADHAGELAVLSGLAERDPDLVLALEMFERDVQETLDGYLAGTIAEESFLERARPWPNYREDYRPLVEFAKGMGLPVIAANVPRRLAAAAARNGGALSEENARDAAALPRVVPLDVKAYRARFMEAVRKMTGAAPMSGMGIEGLYRAQILKDAVMAASLEPFLERRILFCCGRFHSDYRLGIPSQLRKNHPGIKTAVLLSAAAARDLPVKDRPRIADFFWVGGRDAS